MFHCFIKTMIISSHFDVFLSIIVPSVSELRSNSITRAFPKELIEMECNGITTDGDGFCLITAGDKLFRSKHPNDLQINCNLRQVVLLQSFDYFSLLYCYFRYPYCCLRSDECTKETLGQFNALQNIFSKCD
jgi:hypothetical protein